MNLNLPPVRELIRLALAEDLPFGDVTSELTIPAEQHSTGAVLAREPLVFCGSELMTLVFEELRLPAQVTPALPEGSTAEAGAVLARVAGSTRALLAGERTILNFLQRLCGIATHTRAVAAGAGGMVILDTRKTTPGWRRLEKYAVRVGGGRNHRFSLSDLVLVKDNHIAANGGSLPQTLARVFSDKPYYSPVEVEVRNLAELQAALAFPVTVVMLDNMSPEEISAALKVLHSARPEVLVEISGGVRPEQLPVLKALGVNCVSLGSLTTQARWVDIAFKI